VSNFFFNPNKASILICRALAGLFTLNGIMCWYRFGPEVALGSLIAAFVMEVGAHLINLKEIVSASDRTNEDRIIVWMETEDEDLLPYRASSGAVGWDLKAAEDVVIPEGDRVLVGTGIKLEINSPFVEAQVRPRSGRAAREGLTVLNTPGTIDPDYRGEVKVILYNTSNRPVWIRRGERIAQLVFNRVCLPYIVHVDRVRATERGKGGFGSTGK